MPARSAPVPAPPSNLPEEPEKTTSEVILDSPSDAVAADAVTVDDNTDDVIEAALRNVSVKDVITRLEMLVSIYNQREISRQLAVLDIMMDRIGLASFFPSLGEAMSKALEANQYIGNRLEEILTKLKGSVDIPSASNWIENRQEDHPETAGIRQRLEEEDAQEEQRKQMRKEREMARLQDQAPAAKTQDELTALPQPSHVEKVAPIKTR